MDTHLFIGRLINIVCTHVCVDMNMCVCMCKCVYAYVWGCECVYMTCACVCMYMCEHMHVHVYVWACACTCACAVCACTCVYIVLLFHSGEWASPFPAVVTIFHDKWKQTKKMEGGREESRIHKFLLPHALGGWALGISLEFLSSPLLQEFWRRLHLWLKEPWSCFGFTFSSRAARHSKLTLDSASLCSRCLFCSWP